MYKSKHLMLTGLLFFSACGTAYHQQGTLNFNVAWPQTTAFEIKVIPDATREIVLQIFNATGALELEERLKREAGNQKVSLDLSIGKKQLVITARGPNGEILAASRSAVEIKAGEVSLVQSELIPLGLSMTPNPMASPTNGTSNPSSNPSPDPTVSALPIPGDAQSPVPEASSSPNTTPTPQPTPTSDSGGGGGGGGSNGGSASALNVAAQPDRLSGMGYSAFVTATVPSGAAIDSISWTCTPPSGANACGSFANNTPETLWKSPNDNASFGDSTVTSVIFVLTANVVLSNGTSLTQNISMTVNRGTGNIAVPSGSPSGPPNAGNFEGGN